MFRCVKFVTGLTVIFATAGREFFLKIL